MSYYDNNGQWPGATQNNWEHQTPTVRTAGATGPTAQDEFAFSNQFDEVERAYENLSKSGKMFTVPGRMSRGGPSRNQQHGGPDFGDSPRSHGSGNIQGFYQNQRHQPSRGSSEAEQVMQAKRRMAAQRERELRNLHTEQQYQRTAVLADAPYASKPMSEEETRDLIARQRSALYKEGPFAEKGGYVDETGNVRTGVPTHSGPASLRGASPLTYEVGRNQPPAGSDGGLGAAPDATSTAPNQEGSRPNSTSSPQQVNPVVGKGAFDSSSSRGGSPANRDSAGSKPNQPPAVAPIGTRPSAGTPAGNAPASTAKRSTTPLASPAAGGWGRGGWPQSSGLGGQPGSVWA